MNGSGTLKKYMRMKVLCACNTAARSCVLIYLATLRRVAVMVLER